MLNPTIIVGATSAIGSAICSGLRQHDPNVTLFLTGNRRTGQATEQPSTLWFKLDVVDHAAVKAVIDQVAKKTGNVFNVVYCAGVLADKPICNISVSDWQHTFAVNVEGAFSVIKAAYRPLAQGGKGRIVAVSSVASRRPRVGQAGYASSKAALNMLVKTAAIELGRYGVTCNLVVPGALPEGMLADAPDAVLQQMAQGTPLRRLATSVDVAAAVTFLLGAGATQVTGQELVVDGGYLVA